jgi:hypothetical protein
MVGCAGAVAELSWRRDYIDPDYWIDPAFMSQSDWYVAECEPGEPDDLCIEGIEQIAELLMEGGLLWADLQR